MEHTKLLLLLLLLALSFSLACRYVGTSTCEEGISSSHVTSCALMGLTVLGQMTVASAAAVDHLQPASEHKLMCFDFARAMTSSLAHSLCVILL